jgi:hypothetical protein
LIADLPEVEDSLSLAPAKPRSEDHIYLTQKDRLEKNRVFFGSNERRGVHGRYDSWDLEDRS